MESQDTSDLLAAVQLASRSKRRFTHSNQALGNCDPERAFSVGCMAGLPIPAAGFDCYAIAVDELDITHFSTQYPVDVGDRGWSPFVFLYFQGAGQTTQV